MAQSNYNIPNDSAPAVRAQLNSVFQSIASNNSGTSAPATTFAHQWWYDSTANILKQRNAADSAWIDIGTFDQTGGTFTPAGIVQLTQGQAESPASTVFGTVSGQRLAQAVNASVDTASVLSKISNANVGAVGTYAFLRHITLILNSPGTTTAGSNLRYGNSSGGYINTTPPGTWRLMGSSGYDSGGGGAGFAQWQTSLWLRVS
jgi:hypothetical protein